MRGRRSSYPPARPLEGCWGPRVNGGLLRPRAGGGRPSQNLSSSSHGFSQGPRCTARGLFPLFPAAHLPGALPFQSTHFLSPVLPAAAQPPRAILVQHLFSCSLPPPVTPASPRSAAAPQGSAVNPLPFVPSSHTPSLSACPLPGVSQHRMPHACTGPEPLLPGP